MIFEFYMYFCYLFNILNSRLMLHFQRILDYQSQSSPQLQLLIGPLRQYGLAEKTYDVRVTSTFYSTVFCIFSSF